MVNKIGNIVVIFCGITFLIIGSYVAITNFNIEKPLVSMIGTFTVALGISALLWARAKD